MKANKFLHLCSYPGFSLLEMMVSIGILAILTGVSAPLMTRLQETQEVRETVASIKTIEQGLLMYYRDLGDFPLSGSTDPGLNDLISNAVSAGPWNGPYLSHHGAETFNDSWDQPYVYVRSPILEGIPTNGTQRSLLLSTGLNQTQDWTWKDGDPAKGYMDLGQGDDLYRVISSVPVIRRYAEETRDRIRVVMRKVNTRLITEPVLQFSDYDAFNEATAIIDAGLELGDYHRQDLWGNNLRWHAGLKQFYSLGPNRLKNSNGTHLLGDDIGGN